jgi:hypothetical protein
MFIHHPLKQENTTTVTCRPGPLARLPAKSGGSLTSGVGRGCMAHCFSYKYHKLTHRQFGTHTAYAATRTHSRSAGQVLFFPRRALEPTSVGSLARSRVPACVPLVAHGEEDKEWATHHPCRRRCCCFLCSSSACRCKDDALRRARAGAEEEGSRGGASPRASSSAPPPPLTRSVVSVAISLFLVFPKEWRRFLGWLFSVALRRTLGCGVGDP